MARPARRQAGARRRQRRRRPMALMRPVPPAVVAQGGAHDRVLVDAPRRRAPRRSGRHRAPARGRTRCTSSGISVEWNRIAPPASAKRASADRARAWCRHRCRGSGRTAAGCGCRPAAIWRWRSSAGCRRRRPRPASRARGGRPRPRRRRRATAAVSARAVDQAEAAEAVDHRQRDVALAVELQEQALGLAVLRHQADADIGAHRIARARPASPAGRRPGRSPAAQRGHAEAGEEQVLLAHALQAGDAEDLARRAASKLASRELAVRSRARARPAPARPIGRARPAAAAERSASSERPMIIRSPRRRQIASTAAGRDVRGRCAASSAVSQKRAHLGQAVRDEDDRDARRLLSLR